MVQIHPPYYKTTKNIHTGNDVLFINYYRDRVVYVEELFARGNASVYHVIAPVSVSCVIVPTMPGAVLGVIVSVD